jgi:hypothetical protein
MLIIHSWCVIFIHHFYSSQYDVPTSKFYVNFIWFTDEKVFTVASPSNAQNDRLYVSAGTRKNQLSPARLLRTSSNFSKTVMVSVGVSVLGTTSVHFVEPGVKINGAYYRDVLLMEKLLPEIKSLSGDEFFTFQQKCASTQSSRHDHVIAE